MSYFEGRGWGPTSLIGRLLDDEGATMVEYGLMLALIAMICILAVTAIGGNANRVFSDPTLTNALSP
jgi:Flp pilus assembly pilin Flp